MKSSVPIRMSSALDGHPIVAAILADEQGIRKRLDGLDYVMAPQTIMPDDRLVDWTAAQLAKCPCEG